MPTTAPPCLPCPVRRDRLWPLPGRGAGLVRAPEGRGGHCERHGRGGVEPRSGGARLAAHAAAMLAPALHAEGHEVLLRWSLVAVCQAAGPAFSVLLSSLAPLGCACWLMLACALPRTTTTIRRTSSSSSSTTRPPWRPARPLPSRSCSARSACPWTPLPRCSASSVGREGGRGVGAAAGGWGGAHARARHELVRVCKAAPGL